MSKLKLLVASPMQRAIQTCLLSFSPAVKRGLRVVALPIAQESSDETSDVGSSASKIAELFDSSQVDLSNVEDGWNGKNGIYSSETATVKSRAVKLRRWLRSREEDEIVLISHGRFCHFITGDVDDEGEQTTGWWQDAELRSFQFVQDQNDDSSDEAVLQETEESMQQRKAKEISPEGDVID